MKNDKAKWMWYYGEYEIFHSNKLHSRREECGMEFPPFFPLYGTYPRVMFHIETELPCDDVINVKLNGIGRVRVDNKYYPWNSPISLSAGKRLVEIAVVNTTGLPAAFVDGKYLKSGEDWSVTLCNGDVNLTDVGCEPAYYSAADDVEKFPFKYYKSQATCQAEDGGFLYDFGKESFGNIVIEGLTSDAVIYYGESKEEALSKDSGALIYERLTPKKKIKLRPRAFRYVFLAAPVAPKALYAFNEYLPFKSVGAFSCDEEIVEKVYDVAAHTLRLCSREFYLDGIKRDRWVWSGDAYQSFKINRYFCRDDAIIKRTILALLGKPPYFMHVNTINDYSLYLIISVLEYYEDSGDEKFVKAVYPNLKALFLFIRDRLDENGLVVKRPGDWIFIDWANFDREGPHSFEQILLYKAVVTMRTLAAVVGDDVGYLPDAEALKDKIYKLYYKKELGGFIDGFVSGQNKISRQQNIMAVLLGFTTEEENELILNKVLLNDAVDAITTPYFKFYELEALCKLGKVEMAQKEISDYWGGILADGATSIYEVYDPDVKGAEKYAKYGNAFGVSLCHAWGSGPIAFLGAYVAGVTCTSAGGKTYTVKPNPGRYERFSSAVPMGGGKVCVEYSNGGVSVYSTVSGGTLIFGGRSYPIKKGKRLTVGPKEGN